VRSAKEDIGGHTKRGSMRGGREKKGDQGKMLNGESQKGYIRAIGLRKGAEIQKIWYLRHQYKTNHQVGGKGKGGAKKQRGERRRKGRTRLEIYLTRVEKFNGKKSGGEE